jgi:hypothetical protein
MTLNYRAHGKDVPTGPRIRAPLGPSIRDRNEYRPHSVMLPIPQRMNGAGVNKPAVHPKGHPAKLPDGLFLCVSGRRRRREDTPPGSQPAVFISAVATAACPDAQDWAVRRDGAEIGRLSPGPRCATRSEPTDGGGLGFGPNLTYTPHSAFRSVHSACRSFHEAKSWRLQS